MNGNLFGNVSEVWRLAVDFVRDRQRAFWTIREFDALDRHEAMRVLAEAGLGAADFREAVGRPFAFEDLMSRGMDSVGIDPREFAAGNGDWFRYLEHNCAMCRRRGHCRLVMAHSDFADRFHEFCPNSGDFDRILAAGVEGSPPDGDVRGSAPDRPACIN